MAEKRIYFTGWLVPLLNLVVAGALAATALVLGEGLLGAAWWFFLLLAAIFLISAPDGLRWLRLRERDFVVQAFRLRLTGFHIRVEMDYAEVERVEVIGRRMSLVSRAQVRFVALRSEDDRNTWLSSWNFTFSPAALRDLAGRIKAARGAAPEIVTTRAGNRAMTRSTPVLVATLTLFLGGWAILGMLVDQVGWRRTVAESGVAGQARILSLDTSRSGSCGVRLKRLEGGAQRALDMPALWARGRKAGDTVPITVHPDDPDLFTVRGEEWTPGTGIFITLLLIAFGGRFFLRNLGFPQRVLEAVEACFR